MTHLESVQVRLLEAEDSLRESREALAGLPESVIIQMSLGRAQMMRDALYEEFRRLVEATGVAAIDYRLQTNPGSVAIREFADIFGGFQDAFTLAYDASNNKVLKSGPSKDAVEAAQLNFSYAYVSSLGVVLKSCQNDRLFEGDACARALEKLQQFVSPSEKPMKEIAKSGGTHLARAVHRWLKAHHAIGAKVETLTGPPTGFVVTPEDARRVALELSLIEEVDEALEVLDGRLEGIDHVYGTFTFKQGKRTIHGKIDESLRSIEVKVPSEMRVSIRVERRTRYSEDNVSSTYTLVSHFPVQEAMLMAEAPPIDAVAAPDEPLSLPTRTEPEEA